MRSHAPSKAAIEAQHNASVNPRAVAKNDRIIEERVDTQLF
jgi:hypothetical protein